MYAINQVPPNYPVLSVVTPAASDLIVTLDEVKAHIGLPAADTSRDVELTAFIRAATKAVESYCEITLLSTTFQIAHHAFLDRFQLEERPFGAVSSIEYVRETDGEILTVDAADYHVIPTTQKTAMVFLGSGKAWPADVAERHDAVRVTYTAGYANAAAVSDDIKLALLMTVARLDANRGDCACEGGGGGQSVFALKTSTPVPMPKEAQMLLHAYKYIRLITV